jgi:hypothetical protein
VNKLTISTVLIKKRKIFWKILGFKFFREIFITSGEGCYLLQFVNGREAYRQGTQQSYSCVWLLSLTALSPFLRDCGLPGDCKRNGKRNTIHTTFLTLTTRKSIFSDIYFIVQWPYHSRHTIPRTHRHHHDLVQLSSIRLCYRIVSIKTHPSPPTPMLSVWLQNKL